MDRKSLSYRKNFNTFILIFQLLLKALVIQNIINFSNSKYQMRKLTLVMIVLLMLTIKVYTASNEESQKKKDKKLKQHIEGMKEAISDFVEYLDEEDKEEEEAESQENNQNNLQPEYGPQISEEEMNQVMTTQSTKDQLQNWFSMFLQYGHKAVRDLLHYIRSQVIRLLQIIIENFDHYIKTHDKKDLDKIKYSARKLKQIMHNGKIIIDASHTSIAQAFGKVKEGIFSLFSSTYQYVAGNYNQDKKKAGKIPIESDGYEKIENCFHQYRQFCLKCQPNYQQNREMQCTKKYSRSIQKKIVANEQKMMKKIYWRSQWVRKTKENQTPPPSIKG